MSDQSQDEGNEPEVEPQPEPAIGDEPATTPNTPPPAREQGGSEADPAGLDNVTDTGPAT